MIFTRSSRDQPHIIEAMCRWAGPRIGCSFDPERTAGISVQCENGAAVVLYTDWCPRTDIRMHVAGVGHWLTRGALAEFFGFPFQELDLPRVTALVAKKNKKARKFDEKLGFVYEGCARRGAVNGDHLILYGMLREECRWLKEDENGQEQRTVAA